MGRAAGVATLDPASVMYLPEVRAALVEAFVRLRAGADQRGDRGVEKGFETRKDCLIFLELMGSRISAPAVAEHESRSVSAARARSPNDVAALRLLTWNIAGHDLACTALR